MPTSDSIELNCNMDFTGPDFGPLLNKLRIHAESPGAEEAWPEEPLRWLAENHVLGWVIPPEYGGTDISSEQLTAGYEQLTESCLLTAFVLTQRNGACQRIAGSDNFELKSELLPRLCRGELFATVGISHLTTSRQHLHKPMVRVQQTDAGYVLTGTAPWVTGADQADVIVTGGTLDDGRQVLVAVPTDVEGVEVAEPLRMLSLNGSHTGALNMNAVEVAADRLIAGPAEQVMKKGQGHGTGSFATSALAVGVTRGVLRRFRQEAEARPELGEIHKPLNRECTALLDNILAAARGESAEENPALAAGAIRERANSLVLRTSQAYLAATKGTGFVSGHPAERAVREAIFFLVWSCPQPVLTAALRDFACIIET